LGTDLRAIADGMISVTPLSLDLTHEPTREAIGAALSASGRGRIEGTG
jgi:5'-nucleotidase